MRISIIIHRSSNDSAPANEIHDFHRIAIVDDHLGKPLAFDDGEVVLDGNPPRVDLELVEQGDDRKGLLDFERFAVKGDLHFRLFSLRFRPDAVKRPRLGRIERFCQSLISTPR
jgi:hypothetical protein